MNNATGALGYFDGLSLAIAATVFFLVCGMTWGIVAVFEAGHQKRLRRRITSAAEKSKNPEPTALNVNRRTTIRRESDDNSGTGLESLIRRTLPRMALMRIRLDATGRQISLTAYLCVMLVFGGAAFFIIYRMVGLSLFVTFLLALAAAIFIPHLIIGIMITRRQNKFMSQFPEALELMVRGLRSGVPINESMRVVGREIPDPVGAAFRAITDAMVLGRTFNDALTSVSERLNLADFHFFEISLSIQQETGGNLAETLDLLATTLRKRKQMKLKVRALSSEARATAYILGSLPFLMFGTVYAMDPEYMGVLINDPRGHIVLGMAIGTLVIGVAVMIKMGKFEI